MTDAQAEPRMTTVPSIETAVVRGVVATDELPAFFDRSFAALGRALAAAGTTPSGPAFAYYRREPGGTSDLEVGFPVERPVGPSGEVVSSRLPGGTVATVVHRGGYDRLPESWARLHEWVSCLGRSPAPGFWEVYLTEPTPDGDPAQNRTALHLPLRD